MRGGGGVYRRQKDMIKKEKKSDRKLKHTKNSAFC